MKKMQWGWSLVFSVRNHPLVTINLFISNQNGIAWLVFLSKDDDSRFHYFMKILHLCIFEDTKRPKVAPLKMDIVSSPKTNDSEE